MPQIEEKPGETTTSSVEEVEIVMHADSQQASTPSTGAAICPSLALSSSQC